MMKLAHLFVLIIFFAFSMVVDAADFKPYPGAKIDEKETKKANEMAAAAKMVKTKITIYTTQDSFDKVFAFYKGIAKEYTMPRESKTNLPKTKSGQTLKDAFFIFDGSKDITTSKLWVLVQRPYMGRMKADSPENPKFLDQLYEDIRDVTAIMVTENK
jgi:hypothetical protein